jgi:uncharacterized protein DUF1064
MRRKYGNKKVTYDGIEFDSQREFKYYLDFKEQQKAGRISGLEVHPLFRCEINGLKICKYEADFAFVEQGRRRVIDVKSEYTAKLPTFRLKKKLVKALHGIDVEVVL